MATTKVEHVCTYENCGKTFSKPSRLLNHTRTHTGERPYVCQYEGCFKQYTRSAHLKRHEEVSHSLKEGNITDEVEVNYSCDIDGCDRQFQSKYSLKKHQNRLHGQDSYKCPYQGCDEVFRKHQQLKIHTQSHSKASKQNLYSCQFEGCGKTFPFPNRLKKHAKIHEGYRCEVEGCSEKFEKWTQLCQHRRLHHAQSYECKTCGKNFMQKNRLKIHAVIHSDSRQAYECPHDNCDREYLELRNLKAHIRSYHNKERFSCQHSDCGNTYTTKQKLQQHQRVHNPNRSVTKKKRRPKTMAEKLSGILSSQSVISEGSVDSALTTEEFEKDQTWEEEDEEEEEMNMEEDEELNTSISAESLNDSGLSELGSPTNQSQTTTQMLIEQSQNKQTEVTSSGQSISQSEGLIQQEFQMNQPDDLSLNDQPETDQSEGVVRQEIPKSCCAVLPSNRFRDQSEGLVHQKFQESQSDALSMECDSSDNQSKVHILYSESVSSPSNDQLISQKDLVSEISAKPCLVEEEIIQNCTSSCEISDTAQNIADDKTPEAS